MSLTEPGDLLGKIMTDFLIAQPETIKAAIETCKNRLHFGRKDPDHRSIDILRRVKTSGHADQLVIRLYKQ